jgi:8-oxo-dGTP diphosphatase
MKISGNKSDIIAVTCAIIRNEDEKILVVQRGPDTDHPMKWEFPGGKIDSGESEEECIEREIREELSMDIVICSRLADVEFNYGFKKIVLIPFICDTLDELPVLSEHIAFKWIDPHELKDIDLSGADRIVADNYLGDLSEPGIKQDLAFKNDIPEAEESELKLMITETMGMKNAEWVAKSAIENPLMFRKLLEYSYSADTKLAFHASWILTKVCDKYPDIINPFLSDIIESLAKVRNESVQRSFLRIISLKEPDSMDPRLQGLLAEHCFSELRSGLSAIAIKAYSMEILYKLALIYPELANELSASITLIEEEGSAGIKARGRMILRKLAGNDQKN